MLLQPRHMVDMVRLEPHTQSYLIYLNIARQCHAIASARQLRVSRWIAEQRQEHRDDQDWCTRFSSLAKDVLLLWCVFQMPCMQLMEVGYASTSRAGDIRDIVRTCQELVGDGQPLPRNIKVAQQEMDTYRLRVSTSFPDDPIGDGDGLSALRVVDHRGWLGSGDAPINDEPLSSTWTSIAAFS